MSESTAKKWLVISALTVFGVWWYRKWREGPAAVLEAPKFIAGWGAVYFTLALITEASPSFGGSFSMLVLVGDFLGNALPPKGKTTGGVVKDIQDQLGGKTAKGSPIGGWDQAVAAATGSAVAQTLNTQGANTALGNAPGSLPVNPFGAAPVTPAPSAQPFTPSTYNSASYNAGYNYAYTNSGSFNIGNPSWAAGYAAGVARRDQQTLAAPLPRITVN